MSDEKSTAEQDVLKPTPKISFAFGGLTGNLTKTEIKPKEDKELSDTSKSIQASPFANFSFGGSTSKSFTELFSNLNASKQEIISTPDQRDVTSDLSKSIQNDDDNEDGHFEPTAHFEPVIPLPELVDSKTGEEEENIIFCNRAKLLRFDSDTKEWKERGIGEMKVLVKKDDSTKGRLLMRREQVLKLCCNMSITKDIKFVKMSSNALSFAGQDFSDGEMKTEKLAIKFKTPELIKSFQNAVSNVQEKINENKSSVKVDDDIASKKEEIKGFGDKFKPKVGSWTCEACYISNKPESLHCVACESPKDNTVPKKEPKSLLANNASKFNFGMPNQSGFSFGMPSVAQTATTTTISNATQNNLATTGFMFGANSNNSSSISTSNDNVTTNIEFKTDTLFKPFSFGNLSSENTTQHVQKVEFTVNPSVKEIGQNDAGFNFIFKKKSPAKIKSPGKSRNDSINSEGCDDNVGDDNEYHEEEENQTYFTPVIPLPDKVEIKTGEENEKVFKKLYSNRIHLFRYLFIF